MLLILAWIIGALGSQTQELDEVFRRTYTNDELLEFCRSRHSSEAGVRTKGYIHPFYCSRYIECTNVRRLDGSKKLKARENVCGKCAEKGSEVEHGVDRQQNIPTSKPCNFRRLQWDDDKQSCQPQNKNCIQAELPSNNVWGRRKLAHLCQDVPVGTTRTFRHPTHCGMYVTCFRDKEYFQDLWVGVESCPPCRLNITTCPQGFMQYHPTQNGTNAGLCHLVSDIPKSFACTPTTQTPLPTHQRERNAPQPQPLLPATSEAPRNIAENFTKQNTSKKTAIFCKSKEKSSRRYPVPEKCNSYYHCYVDLPDRTGDERQFDKVKHFKILCDTCTGTHCNPTTDGQPNYLQFDFEQQTCVIPLNGTCIGNGTFVPNEHELTEQKESAPNSWKKGILSQEEVTSFCKKQKSDGNFLHPNDTTCSHYIECWTKMGVFKEKSCPECHPSIKDSGTLCPSGHLYFNASSGVCQIGLEDTSSCGTERGNDNKEGGSFVWSSSTTPTPNPRPQLFENTSFEAAHPELLTLKECHLKHYVQRGYCKKFFTCDRKKRMEKQHECSGRLFWNPDVNSIHGGVCDYLRNIDNFTLYQYKKDPACPLHVAYFRRDEAECSGTYYYHHPTRTQGKEMKLKCPEDLVWSKEAKTCTKCHEVFKKDGVTPCCAEANVEDLDYP